MSILQGYKLRVSKRCSVLAGTACIVCDSLVKSSILSPPDYHIARLAARGVSNGKIAEQFHISLGTLIKYSLI